MDSVEEKFHAATDRAKKECDQKLKELIYEHEPFTVPDNAEENSALMGRDMSNKLMVFYAADVLLMDKYKEGGLEVRTEIITEFIDWFNREVVPNFVQWFHWYCCEVRSSKDRMALPFKLMSLKD